MSDYSSKRMEFIEESKRLNDLLNEKLSLKKTTILKKIILLKHYLKKRQKKG